MQSIHLNFYQRNSLWNVVGNHNALNLKEAAVFLRIIDKLRPTDKEMLDTGYLAEGPQIMWKLPTREYGNREVELENEEAAALRSAIETVSNFPVKDAQWMLDLVERLKAPPVVNPPASAVA